MSEKKYTQEEIRTIVDGAIRKANLSSKRELSTSELEKVNGGIDVGSIFEDTRLKFFGDRNDDPDKKRPVKYPVGRPAKTTDRMA